MVTKECTCCKKTLTVDNFYIRKDRKDSYTAQCKKCTIVRNSGYRNQDHTKKYKAEYYLKNKNKKLNNDLKKYGLTLVDYENLLTEQNNCCAICKTNPGKRMSVDHCHETGKVRGLLCSACNFMLGHAKDSKDTLKQAIAYLLQYEKK